GPEISHYDVAADGRYIMVRPGAEAEPGGEETAPELRVVLNWFEELNRLAPAED
ncbi:MAG: hypothetical protein IH939_15110, partial [Acidobacteria bacterium]|nr:hypothetical protein [Acidobacteriota bacterium]